MFRRLAQWVVHKYKDTTIPAKQFPPPRQSNMSIESRLTLLQTKLDNLIEVSTHRRRRGEMEEDEESREEWISPKNPQAEIRTFELWRKVMAECLGTLCYVFFVCGVSIPWTGHFPPFLSVAFASALAYGALTYKVFPGAHLNPAFTLAIAAVQKISSLRCLLFVTAQASGAIAGAAILFGMSSPGYQGTLGATTIASHVEPAQAFGLELILSFVLTLTFVTNPNNCVPTTAILLAANLVALPCTGASLNPVRSLGPAFVMNKWPKHWVFWLGPIMGALMAAYFNRFILRRDNKSRRARENPSDGDSMDIPPTELPTAVPDRLLCERFEPLYSGTRSLYTKPSPVLPRSNLNRSQSVYASKRFDFPSKCLDSASSFRKHHQSTTNTNQFQAPDSNYEPLYERKHQGLLVSGPPSYDSAYYKTYEKPHSTGGHHFHENHGHPRHNREKSDSHSYHGGGHSRDRDNHHTNRILAQYETAKGLVDVDPKAALHAQQHERVKSSIYYESSEMQQHSGRKQVEVPEKKLIDTGSECGGTSSGKNHGNPPTPSRFRNPPQIPPPPHEQQRYPPPGQCSSASSTATTETTNDLSRTHGGQHSLHSKNLALLEQQHKQQQQQHSIVLPARKPYEILESNKLMQFSPHSQEGQSHTFSPRILMAEKDSTYCRILEPMMNSKPPSASPHNKHVQSLHGHGYGHNLSPNDHLTYSYH